MHTLTRRDLMILASAGLAAAAAPVSKMRFGFTSYKWGADWDLPTMIANLTRLEVFSTELRTRAGDEAKGYAHGVELTLTAAERREVKKRFADSPIELLGLSADLRFDSPDPARLNEQIERTKAYVRLSEDVGGKGVRVFPNDFHRDVPQEKTIEQIAAALNVVGRFAADHGQRIRLENHGTAGDLVTISKIMAGVGEKNVGVKLNAEVRDAADFAQRFALVKDRLDDTLHFHDLTKQDFPHQLQYDLLTQAGWSGWWQLEASHAVADRMAAIAEQRRLWEAMCSRSRGERS